MPWTAYTKWTISIIVPLAMVGGNCARADPVLVTQIGTPTNTPQVFSQDITGTINTGFGFFQPFSSGPITSNGAWSSTLTITGHTGGTGFLGLNPQPDFLNAKWQVQRMGGPQLGGQVTFTTSGVFDSGGLLAGKTGSGPFPNNPITSGSANPRGDSATLQLFIDRIDPVGGLTGFTVKLRASSAVPEPSTLALLSLSTLGLLGYGWRRRRAASAGASDAGRLERP
jgi:hypothetical protein